LLHDRAFPPAWKGFWACKCAVPYLPSTSAFRETGQAIPSDHSEFMVQALQLDVGYRESFLGVAGKQALTGERLARVSPTPVST
jgi:hypothetical protein